MKSYGSRPTGMEAGVEERRLARMTAMIDRWDRPFHAAHEAGHALIAHLLEVPPVQIELFSGRDDIGGLCECSDPRQLEGDHRRQVEKLIMIKYGGPVAEGLRSRKGNPLRNPLRSPHVGEADELAAEFIADDKDREAYLRRLWDDTAVLLRKRANRKALKALERELLRQWCLDWWGIQLVIAEAIGGRESAGQMYVPGIDGGG